MYPEPVLLHLDHTDVRFVARPVVFVRTKCLETECCVQWHLEGCYLARVSLIAGYYIVNKQLVAPFISGSWIISYRFRLLSATVDRTVNI